LYSGPKATVKAVNSTKASPKLTMDPRDRCRIEGPSAAKEKLSIYSGSLQKKKVPELNFNKDSPSTINR